MFFTVLTYLVIGLLAVFGLFYIVLEARFFRALGSVRVGNSDVEPAPKVSILIAARNEAAGIRETLDSVLAQDYRGEWDVWVADDRSDDETPAILAEYAAKNPRLHVLTIKEIPEGVSPKKHALSLLIEACEGEILCLTDADCLVKPTWVTGITAEFEPGIELVAGHSYIPTIPGKSSVLICMQAIETLIYRVAGTAGLAMRLPLTSTGNNLAYRKSFFKSVHGFDNVIKIQSGDDDLLMQKLAADRPCHAILHRRIHLRDHQRQGNPEGTLGTTQALGLEDYLLYTENRVCAEHGVPVPGHAMCGSSVCTVQL